MNGTRNNNIGTLHLIGALFVMIGHQCALTQLQCPVILGSAIQAIGVRTIFLISGYLITKSLWRQDSGKGKNSIIYFIKRMGRLYPEFVGCLVVSALILCPLVSAANIKSYYSSPGVWAYILKNMGLFITYGIGTDSVPGGGIFLNNPYPGAINGSLWTMPVEVLAYVIIWVIYILPLSERNRKRVYGLFTVALIVLYYIWIGKYADKTFIIYGTNWLGALDVIPYIFIGGSAYLFHLKQYMNEQWAMALFFVFCGIAFKSAIVANVICMMVLTCFVVSIAESERQNLTLRFIKSEYSYGIYLYAFVVQQCVISRIYLANPEMNKVLLFFLSAIITYVFAAISYNYIYVPANKFFSKVILKIEKYRKRVENSHEEVKPERK